MIEILRELADDIRDSRAHQAFLLGLVVLTVLAAVWKFGTRPQVDSQRQQQVEQALQELGWR